METKEFIIRYRGSKLVPLDKLIPFQGELKSLSEANYNKLKKEILTTGFTEPISAWEKGDSYMVLNGHQRLRVLQKMIKDDGYKIATIPINIIDAKDEKEAKRMVLSLASQYGELEPQGLYEFLTTNDFELEMVDDFSFPEIDTDDFLEEFSDDEKYTDKDADSVPENVLDIVKPGELWQLGEHRLLCGDCTVKENVERLMNGEKAILMVTDPPYGVDYKPDWRNKALGEANRAIGLVKNDSRFDWLDAYKLFSGDVAYVWHAGRYAKHTQENIEAAGFEVVSQIIWAKQHFALSRGDYHWKHEPCWYAVRAGEKHNWQGARDQSTLWEINNGLSQGGGTKEEKTGHGTQKPVECMERPIRNNTATGESVYDPFLGSGSTLIACEKTNRKCFGCEIDPHYCSVIVQRWETFTGKKAIKIS